MTLLASWRPCPNCRWTRSPGCYTGRHTGTLVATSEIEELRWLTLADRHRTSTIDQLVDDALSAAGHLRDR